MDEEMLSELALKDKAARDSAAALVAPRSATGIPFSPKAISALLVGLGAVLKVFGIKDIPSVSGEVISLPPEIVRPLTMIKAATEEALKEGAIDPGLVIAPDLIKKDSDLVFLGAQLSKLAKSSSFKEFLLEEESDKGEGSEVQELEKPEQKLSAPSDAEVMSIYSKALKK